MRKIISQIMFFLLTSLFIVGGLGINTSDAIYLGLGVGVLSLIWAVIIKRKKLQLPKAFFIFIPFLLTVFLSVFWVGRQNFKLDFALLFLSGAIFLISFYNLREEMREFLPKSILISGIAFGALCLIEFIRHRELPVNSLSLYLPSNAWRNHNHLGDLWAIVLLILVYWNILKPKLIHWVLIAFGAFFLAISLSRSSYLAFGVGIIYLFRKMGWIEKYKKVFALFILLLVVWLFHSAFYKSVLLSRPYFLQALVGLIKYPFGVGLGNFGTISSDPQILGEVKSFSFFTHNIVLEIMVGLGVLGLTFVFWLGYLIKGIFFVKSESKKFMLYEALFLAITSNFFFDATYVIPTMLWMWYISLGFALAKGDY